MTERSGCLPTPFEVVVVAGSLGGQQASSATLGGLPADFPTPVVVVQHMAPGLDLAAWLQRSTRLACRPAVAGAGLEPGVVHVAPARGQLRIDDDGRFEHDEDDDVACSPDGVFRSAARRYGAGAIGVVLSGRLRGGADGAAAIKVAGGRVLVQDPTDAREPSMPRAAMATGCVDFVLPASCLGAALVALTMAPGAAELLRVPVAHWAVPSPA